MDAFGVPPISGTPQLLRKPGIAGVLRSAQVVARTKVNPKDIGDIQIGSWDFHEFLPKIPGDFQEVKGISRR